MTTWKQKREDLWEHAQVRYKGKLRIRPKSEAKAWWKFLAFLLKSLNWIASLGKTTGTDLYDGFNTTMGQTIWLAGDGTKWENTTEVYKFTTISHEIDHFDLFFFDDHKLQEAETQPDKDPSWLSAAWHGLRYQLFASHRSYVESLGYERNMRVQMVLYEGSVPASFKQWVRKIFTGPAYFYMASPARFEQLYADMLERTKIAYSNGKLEHLQAE